MLQHVFFCISEGDIVIFDRRLISAQRGCVREFFFSVIRHLFFQEQGFDTVETCRGYSKPCHLGIVTFDCIKKVKEEQRHTDHIHIRDQFQMEKIGTK